MGHFMERGERPSGFRVLIVYNHQWSDHIGNSETTECFNWYVCVVTSKVAEKQDENAGPFNLLPKIIEGQLGSCLPTKFSKRESYPFPDPACELFRWDFHSGGAHKIQLLRFSLVEQRFDDHLTPANVTYQGVEDGVIKGRPSAWNRTKIPPPVACSRGLVKVKNEQ